MNTKDGAILLIFLLAVTGLIVGVYCTEAESMDNAPGNSGEAIVEDADGTITITLDVNEKESFLDGFFT